MSTGILGWLFGKDPNKAFNKGVEKVANHHSHKSFGQLFEEATEELGNLQAGLAKAITPFSVSLPAAKYLDLGIGVDLHSTVAPPSPMMPVPNTIMVFDIIGAIFGGIAMLVPDPPPPPPPAEGEEPAPSPITLASVGRTIVDMMRPTVKVNGRWIANAGTSIQHLPAIFFHLAPSVAPMAEGEVYMGSSTVVADGAPFTYQFLPCLSCNLIGIPSPFRPRRMKTPKLALKAPTVMLTSVIPSGNPVMVGGSPTIDLFALLINLGLKGLGKLWKHTGGALFDKLWQKINKKYPKFAKWRQHLKCKLFGEPVDVATGRVVSENEDFSLTGAIPVRFLRQYYSDRDEVGALGRGWFHNYEMYHLPADDEGYILVHLWDGRWTGMPALAEGETYWNTKDKLLWRKEQGQYILENPAEGLYYHFDTHAKKAVKEDVKEPIKNQRHKLTTIENGLGDKIVLTYDLKERLHNLTDTAGRILHFEYENSEFPYLLTSIKCEAAALSWQHTYQYNEQGQLSRVIDAAGAVKLFEYNNIGLLCHLKNQLGGNFYWAYEGKDSNAKCVHTWGDEGILEYHAVYEEGKTIVTNSLGHTTVYEYDHRKLITQITSPKGEITIFRYDDNEDQVLVLDPMGNANRYEYDTNSNLIAHTNAYNQTQYFSYDAKNQLISHRNFEGGKTQWSYNPSGQLTEVIYPDDKKLQLSYEGSHLIEIVDREGNSTKLSWDKAHNLTTLILPNGNQTQMQYDALGRLIRNRADNGAISTYAYDIVGNLLELTEPTGNIHRFTYDRAGNVLSAKDEAREVHFKYWGLGKLKERIEQGRKLTFYYNTEEQLKSIRNEAGERYRLERDANGNVIGEWGFDGLNRTYERNPNGQVIEVTSPLHKATYSYTPLGQLSSVNYDDGNYEWFTYDKLGRITQAENPTSQTLWEYDVLGRIIAETQNGHRITHQYNAYGNRTAMESSLGAKLQHTYNEWGECLRTEVNQQAQAQTQAQATTPIALWQASYGYNRMGWEVARFLQGDVVQHTDYDLAGRVVVQRTDKAHSSGGYELSRRQYVWNPANQLKAIIYNGKHTSFDYDAVGNLASATYNQTETIYKVPDAVGNLYRTPDRKGYTYSEGGRLLECPDWKYVYDLEGRLIEKISKKQQLKRFSLIVEEDEKPATLRWFYSWNANGSLKSVANNDRVHFAFEYDALGRRTAKINLSSKRIKRFLWDGNVPLHEWEYDLSERPNLSRDKDNLLVYDKEEPITENLITWVFDENSFVPAAKLVGDKSYSILTDHLGTPYEAYDESGEKVWSAEYDLYGNIHTLEGEKGFIPFRYQGQYEDIEIGLYYNRFRYYSPDSGTYISQDPIRLAGGLAFYGYVFDCNGWIDPWGLEIITVYRFDTRSPAEIKKSGGFNAKSPNSNIDLLEYAEMNTPSQYISTSYSIDSAIDFGNDYHGGDGYIYKIEIDDSLGVDVNKTLGSNSPFPNEKEFAVINKIPNENIVDTTHMKDIKKKKHH